MRWGEDVAAAFSDDVKPMARFGPAFIDCAERQSLLRADEAAESKAVTEFAFEFIRIHARGFWLHGVEDIEAHFDEGWL